MVKNNKYYIERGLFAALMLVAVYGIKMVKEYSSIPAQLLPFNPSIAGLLLGILFTCLICVVLWIVDALLTTVLWDYKAIEE